jgi:hypothetical protein
MLTTYPYGGGVDAFLVSFDGNGTRNWGRYFGGTLDDVGLSIGVDASSNVYMSWSDGQ